MNTVEQIINAFGGAAEFAQAIDIERTTAIMMARNGRIRGTYWLRVVEEAKARRLRGVTLETLARIHAG